ncbi:MCE family protein [Prescottella agglutinans]|uniref:Phospholipid/cholesterol/gamma-HCH transport system substrate-binding protein n=1 Tax=Prescottella agglutinans TaxID=1644129 RepID=A0ABT6MDS1_9NOCA|nr:MCE family protein [Prescottella agglutinans]MDH6282442.1 phospholipid/cholesterol/gamma-HCH transport system substrate-binding protein [Prescottella agglutinans]
MVGRHGTGQVAFAMRGAIAVLVAVVAGAAMVMRGTGQLQRDPEVVVGIPAAAGLVNGEAPVRYHGVNVGRISGIDSGIESSRVRLQIDSDAINAIPASVVVRVVPRTFFGDIYIQLVDAGPDPDGALSDRDELRMDESPDSVALYAVYTRLVEVLDRMQPQRMQVALSALAQALGGRGATVGRIIDRLDAAAPTLTPAVQALLEATPDFRTVLQALDTATPDVVATLASTTDMSRTVVENRAQVADTIGAAAGFASVLAGFVGEQRDRIITVLDASGTVLATTAADPEGLTGTLDRARTFGAAGARVFATGHFDIVAVPTFAEPLPYTSADCPSYGNLPGACGPSTVDGGPREQRALDVLRDRLLGNTPGFDDRAPTNPLAPVMLGPLVRGTEVRVR